MHVIPASTGCTDCVAGKVSAAGYRRWPPTRAQAGQPHAPRQPARAFAPTPNLI
jgi:hypothetical protein